MNEEDWEELKHTGERFACFVAGMIVTLTLVSLLSGCCPCKHIATNTTNSRDSIVIHDSIVITKLDTVYVSVPQERDAAIALPSDTAKASTSISAAWSWLVDGRIVLKLWNYGKLPAVVPRTTTTINDKQLNNSTNQQTKIVEVQQPLTNWQKFQIRGFWVVLCVAVCYLLWHYRKLLLLLLKKILLKL